MIEIKGNYKHSFLNSFIEDGDSVLDLMCGKGDSLCEVVGRVSFGIAVDIYKPYLDKIKWDKVTKEHSDSLKFLKLQKDNSVDVIMCIDGIEHLEKDVGLELIQEMKRVAKKRIVIFTPDGLTENHPHDAWNIKGGDEFQEHKSGWSMEDFTPLGFELANRTSWTNAYNGKPYDSLLVYWNKGD